MKINSSLTRLAGAPVLSSLLALSAYFLGYGTCSGFDSGLSGIAQAVVVVSTVDAPPSAAETSLTEPQWVLRTPSGLAKEERRFSTPSSMMAIWWSPNGKWLASIGFADRNLYVWEPGNEKLVATIELRYDPLKYHHGRVGWSPDGKWLAVAQGREGVKIISTTDWKLSVTNPYGELWGDRALADKIGIPESVYFTPDSKRLIIYLNYKVGVLGHVALWDAATWEQISIMDLQPENEQGRNRDDRRSTIPKDVYSPVNPNSLAFYTNRHLTSDQFKVPSGWPIGRDGKPQINDAWLEIRSLTTGVPLMRFKPYVTRTEHDSLWGSMVKDLVIDPVGEHLALADRAGSRVSIWDLKSGKRIQLLYEELDVESGSARTTDALAYTPDGRFLIGNNYRQNGHVLFWQLPKYRLANVIRNVLFPTAIAVSPDSRRVAFSSGKEIRIYVIQF